MNQSEQHGERALHEMLRRPEPSIGRVIEASSQAFGSLLWRKILPDRPSIGVCFPMVSQPQCWWS